MDNNQKDNNQKESMSAWDEIFNNIEARNLSLEMFDSMPIELLVKYYCVVEMQFYAFERMCEGDNDVSNEMDYHTTNNDSDHFQGNKNDYLNLSSAVKNLYKYREQIIKKIKENDIKNDEFVKLFENTLNEYKVVYQI